MSNGSSRRGTRAGPARLEVAAGAPPREDPKLPIVTVFGAGIAGLTAAHELIERGFRVQVVETAPSPFEEYECDVGGLAANQCSRVRAPVEEVHPMLTQPGCEDDLDRVRRFRYGEIEEAQARFPIPQRIRFDKTKHRPGAAAAAAGGVEPDRPPRTSHEPTGPLPADWWDYWDEHGVYNIAKLGAVLDMMRNAITAYGRAFDAELSRFAGAPAEGAGPADTAAQVLEVEAVAAAAVEDEEEGEGTGAAEQAVEAQPVASPIEDHPDYQAAFAAGEKLLVRILGYTDADGVAEENRAIGLDWAEEVKAKLLELNAARAPDLQIPDLALHLETRTHGSANPRYDQSTAVGRSRSNRVEFQVVEQVLPGEHGFRFFPNFYRHLFDTMRRTPLLDARNDATGASAYDQLVATPDAQLALDDGKDPFSVRLRRFHSLRQVYEAAEVFLGRLGFTGADVLGLQYFFLRYMTSCAARRTREAEPINLVEYVGGEEKYSKNALYFIDKTPRALAAMSARESDARTQFDIVIQLMGIDPTKDFVSDMTLNGPTSTAWLGYWKTYLKVQGVKFFVGELAGIDLDNGEFIPRVEGPGDRAEPRPEDAYDLYQAPAAGGDPGHRYVLALPFQAASDMVWGAERQAQAAGIALSGPFRQLIEFDTRTGRRTDADKPATDPVREPETGRPPADYPLRTISGIQYFFPHQYRFGEGNVFFVDAPWGLTSISQFAYWRDRIRPVGEFLGQISIDIGDWHAFYPLQPGAPRPESAAQDGPPPEPGHPAWRCSSHEIADKTWRQVKSGLDKGFSQVIAAPRYYHIDDHIVFYESGEAGFEGNLVFRIADRSAPDGGIPILEDTYAIDLVWELAEWGEPRGSGPRAQSVAVRVDEGDGAAEVAKALARRINQRHRNIAGAVAEDDGAGNAALLLSPTLRGKSFLITLRGRSLRPYYFVVNGHIIELPSRFLLPIDEFVRQVSRRLEASGLAPSIEYQHLGGRTYQLTTSESIYLTVANRDGMFELLDGPQLAARTASRGLQLVGAAPPASGETFRAAVRANAVVVLKSPRGDDFFDAGRTYGLSVEVGSAAMTVLYEAQPGETWSDARDALVGALEDIEHVVAVSLDRNAQGTRARGGDAVADRAIVLSPVAEVERTVIRVLGRSDEDFVVTVNDEDFTIGGAGRVAVSVRNDILDAFRQAIATRAIEPPEGHSFEAEAIGTHSVSLALVRADDAPPGARARFRVSVLNLDRQIELVGAPPLVIGVKDAVLEQPAEGFVPLRNTAEFLINVPKQWQWRPGLYDNDREVHLTLPGVDPEHVGIFYAHRDCRQLRHWVAAGSYMATYTRMTTMEAAAESARHAVRAILHEFVVPDQAAAGAAQGPFALPGDFPQIWDPEENEPDDLKYFKEVDAALCREGLPHMLDILSMTQLVDSVLEWQGDDEPLRDYVEKARKVMYGLVAPAALQSAKIGGDLLGAVTEKYLAYVEQQVDPLDEKDAARMMTRRYIDAVRKSAETLRSFRKT